MEPSGYTLEGVCIFWNLVLKAATNLIAALSKLFEERDMAVGNPQDMVSVNLNFILRMRIDSRIVAGQHG